MDEVQHRYIPPRAQRRQVQVEKCIDTANSDVFKAAFLHGMGMPDGKPVFIMADTNETLGSEQSDAVGHIHPEDEPKEGAYVHDLMLQTDSCAPSTFIADEAGDSTTWTPPQGGRGHRIDYRNCSSGDIHPIARSLVV